MLRNADKEKLYTEISNIADHVRTNKNINIAFKRSLKGKGMDEVDVDRILTDLKELEKEDEPVTLVFAEALNWVSELKKLKAKINLEEYYSESELRQTVSYKYQKSKGYEKKELPLTFDKVLIGNHDSYTLNLSARELGELKLSGLTNWNPRVQREGVTKVINGEIVVQPKFYKKNRKDIKENILKGEQEETLVVLNLPLGSTLVKSEEKQLVTDLEYDPKNLELTIDNGSLLDIVDGAHRIQACADAIEEDPENENLDKVHFTVKILNVDDDKARNYQAQLAKATPLQRSRVTELSQERLTDRVVEKLKTNPSSELKGKISSSDLPNRKIGEVTTYGIMADSLNKYWSDLVTNQLQVLQASKVLEEYYMYLFGTFSEYTDDRENLLFDRRTFIYHNAFAAELYRNKIDFAEGMTYINPSRFNVKTFKSQHNKLYEILRNRPYKTLSSVNLTKKFKEAFDMKIPEYVLENR